MTKIIDVIKRVIQNTDRMTHFLDAAVQGIANQSRLINEKTNEIVQGVANQSMTSNQKLDEIIAALRNQSHLRAESRPTHADGPKAVAVGHPHAAISLDEALRVIREHGKAAPTAARIFDQILRDLVAPHHQTLSWGDRLLTLDKSATFKDDPQFKQALGQCKSSTGANQYSSPDSIAWRLNTLVWASRSALKIPGDFVECGVYQGDMSWVVTESTDLARAGKTFYLYDTFEGFSPNYSSDADFPDAPQLLATSNRAYQIPQLYETVRNRFATKSYVRVIKGVVPDILREIAPVRIAFLHIDMNSPRAEAGALDILFERVSSGGIVIFDDYGWSIFRKQKHAADQFMAARGYDVLELPTGQGMIVKR